MGVKISLVEKLTFFHLIYIFQKNDTLEIPSAVLKNAQIQELLGVLLPGLPPRCCPRTPTGPWWPPAPPAKIGLTSDVDNIFSKMYSQYVLFRNKYS
jgi:hypothetical protein